MSAIEISHGGVVFATIDEMPGSVTLNTKDKLVSDFIKVSANTPSAPAWDKSYSLRLSVTVTASGSGTVSGGGLFTSGQSCTVTASAQSGNAFTGWYNGSTLVSSSTSYTFTVTESVSLTAKFEQIVSRTVTLSGSGNTSYCYATIGGTKRYGSGTYTVNSGDKITFGVYGRSSSYPGWVKVNGESILDVTNASTQTVEWVVPKGSGGTITISFSYTSTSSQRRGQITVTA